MAKALKPTDRLLVPFGTTRKLAKDCGVSENTVAEALRGTRDTETYSQTCRRVLRS